MRLPRPLGQEARPFRAQADEPLVAALAALDQHGPMSEISTAQILLELVDDEAR